MLRLEKQNAVTFVKITGILLVLVLVASCSYLRNEEPGRTPIARVGQIYLYKEEVAPLLNKAISKEDSASFVTNYINNWASKQLLLDKARINLPVEKLAEFDVLVNDYRSDLYTRAYKEALV
ncbi:MAG: peptidyl-prolyl cis-trans isomerase, partial [Flavobacteriaceae bacterium]